MNAKKPSAYHVNDAPVRTGSRYPDPYDKPCIGRSKALLGDMFGLDQFGINVATIAPGSWSSQRHWHRMEDEFIYVLVGELVLVDDSGETVMRPGMFAGFKANNGNGHHLKNLSTEAAVYLEVGSRFKSENVVYSDIDMKGENIEGRFVYTTKDGRRI
jgi:uncharacterized cupin superfamily protein